MRSRGPHWKFTRVTLIAVGVLLALATGALVVTGGNVVPNTWLLITEPTNVIPRESSVWRFTPTVMNTGSGDWWIYGKDAENYYYFTGFDDQPYIAISKIDATGCAGFNSEDFRTWCN